MAARKKQKAVGEDELAQRVAILRRFRELLIQQRERFHSYLASLEKQQTAIESGNVEELIAYVELEEQIVTDIFSIQKVIEPLEHLYNVAISDSSADDVSSIKTALEDLKSQAITRSAHNRELISSRMTEIRAEITNLRNNPFVSTSRSRYQSSGSASLIDIEG